jgi:hypothetical protein
MSTKQTVTIASAVALIVCGTFLDLLWSYGIWEIMLFGKTDVRVILWPSSSMITVGWRSNPAGITMTISSIAINCILYVAVALLLRRCFQWITGSNRTEHF